MDLDKLMDLDKQLDRLMALKRIELLMTYIKETIATGKLARPDKEKEFNQIADEFIMLMQRYLNTLSS